MEKDEKYGIICSLATGKAPVVYITALQKHYSQVFRNP